MNHALRVLVAEIDRDRTAMAKHAARVAEVLADTPFAPDDWRNLAALASTIDSWYTALDAVGERVARMFEGVPARGPEWHRRLLETMSLPIDGVRAAVIAESGLVDLRELLGFRHVLRHAYHAELDPVRLVDLGRRLVRAHGVVAADLDRFVSSLRAGFEQAT